MYSAAFDLGTGVHCCTLQSDLFTICEEVDKPTAKVGALADRLYSTYKTREITTEDIIKEATIIDYYGGNLNSAKIKAVLEKCEPYWRDRKQFEEHYNEDKTLLYFDPKSRHTVQSCVKALASNKKIQDLLHPTGLIEDPISDTEQAILLDVQVESDKGNFKLRLKSKLDHFSIDRDTNTVTVNDVKTIGKIVSEMSSNIEKFHYNRELAMYSWLLSLCAEKYYGLEKPTIKGNYLVVSTIPAYYTKVIPMTKGMFKEGWNEFRRLLRLVAECVANDNPEFGIWN